MFVDIRAEQNRAEPYEVVYTDPPWAQTKGGLRKARPNQGKKLDYPTMTLDEIKDTQMKVMKLCLPDHSCFIWTIDKFLPQTEELMESLGYRRHARFVWDKENGIAPAFSVRFSHEYLLWYYYGKFQPVAKDVRGKFSTVIRERATSHSRKPDSVRSMIEAMYPNAPKLELFARETAEGWDCWGNDPNIGAPQSNLTAIAEATSGADCNAPISNTPPNDTSAISAIRAKFGGL